MQRKLAHLLLVILILLAGIGTTAFLISTKPPLKKKKRRVQIPIVRVIRVSKAPHQIKITENGTVRATRLIKLIPQVSGKVIYISPNFTEGGYFQKNELLMVIDPTDYELALKRAEAELKEAESNLAQLSAEAKLSLEEWHSYARGKLPPELIAKKPQLKAAQARLAAAKANLKLARLNLKRTKIQAPFAGRVQEKAVDVGQYVSPGQPLATIYATKAMDVVIQLPEEKVRWLQVPGYNTEHNASPAQIRLVTSQNPHVLWQGRIYSLGGRVDERTRLIPVIVRVASPFQKGFPLLPGLYVRIILRGKTIPKAVVLPLECLHQTPAGTWKVWVVEKGSRLRFRPVKVVYMYADQAVITAGLSTGELVVSSPLDIVTDGMEVRIAK